MKTHWFFLLLAIIPLCPCNSLCRAEEAELTLDSVLEKWEKASQECKILDMKLALFQYDSTFPTAKPDRMYGRFYYEDPNTARLDFSKKSNFKTNEWSAIEDCIIWKGTEAQRISTKSHAYFQMPIDKIQEAQEQPIQGFWGFYAKLWTAMLPPPRPQSQFPFLVDVRTEDIRKQYDISFERNDNVIGGDILLTAIPKKSARSPFSDSKIRVIFDSWSYRIKGIQYISSHGTLSVVPYDQKFNEKPGDRDQLIEPDLSGFHQIGKENFVGPNPGK